MVFSIFTVIFTQYIDSHTRRPVFSFSMWLLCSYCSLCFCSWKGLILLLSLHCLWALLIHILLASIVVCCDPLLVSCVARPVLCVPSASAGVRPVVLLLICLLWAYTLACPQKCWWHLHLYSFQQLCGLCFLCGCYRTASPECISLGQACILCVSWLVYS